MGKLKLVLIAVLVLGFIFRLYRFNGPIADWHSWRQTDTSAVSRNFVKSGYDFLHPKFDDLSNVPSGLDNPNGYRFVEFPIYNFFQAFFYKSAGIFTLEEWGRLVTIFSSLSTAFLLYLILKKHHSETAGVVAAFFYCTIPFSVYYGRTILPDPSTAASVLAGVYFFDLWIDETKKDKKENRYFTFLILSAIFTSLALLLKPFAVFFTLPMAVLVLERFGIGFIKKWELWFMAAVALIPLFLWRVWMSSFPEGIPVNSWLFNEGGLRFKGPFFYWVFAERIGKLILGYWGVGILVFGFLAKVKDNALFFYSFIASSLIYITVVARGNIQHDYYQILIIPTLCIFLGLGGDYLLRNTDRLKGALLFSVLTLFTLFFGWYYIRDYFNINNRAIVVAGEAVDRLTPKDAKVVANYNGDTSFLYQTNRQGWASYEKDLAGMVELGADYLVLVNPNPSDFEFAGEYKIVDQTSEYVIFDLRKAP